MLSRLIDDVRSVLETAGFETIRTRPDSTSLDFEDISLLGQVSVFESAEQILATWQLTQDRFLRDNAEQFLRDTTKAWNLYTVLLTSEAATASFAGRLFSIEDDFRGTRKIARCGVVSRQDVLAAMAPILPLQNVLTVGLVDAKQRLLQRLDSITPVLRNVATGGSPESIAASLLGNE